jgi:hypothetical protein
VGVIIVNWIASKNRDSNTIADCDLRCGAYNRRLSLIIFQNRRRDLCYHRTRKNNLS